jgi:hypothetical protein
LHGLCAEVPGERRLRLGGMAGERSLQSAEALQVHLLAQGTVPAQIEQPLHEGEERQVARLGPGIGDEPPGERL